MSRSGVGRMTAAGPFLLLARIGLVIYGAVHLLVAWLVVQVAVGDLDGDGVGKADKTGALQAIAASGAGVWPFWVITVGLGATALWHLVEAALDRSGGSHRVMKLGEAVLFGYLSWSAGRIAAGAPSSTDAAQSGLVGWLLGQSWGKPVVIALGVGVVVAALFIVRHGITRRFSREHDLSAASPPARTVVSRLGQIGYTGLGAVYGVAGALVVVAAVRSEPAKATGLDVALRTLAVQPYGTVLLLLIAAGLVAFALFTFVDARYRRAG